jgi:recombination protein RecT
MSDTTKTPAVRSATAPAQISPAAAIKQRLNDYRPVIEKLLTGTGTSVETYTAQVANALRAVPELWKCDIESVLGATLKAAQLGLAPNDGRNLCWILPYAGKAQFQMGYVGYMELARRAVPGLKFDGRAVYPNDDFDVDYGKDEPLTHRPAIAKGADNGGDAYAWYVRARFPDGTTQIEVLNRAKVEYHRKFSKQPTGKMWTESYDAAALKSGVSDLKRWLPSSPQLVAAFAADDATFDVRNAEPINVGEITHEVDPDEVAA